MKILSKIILLASVIHGRKPSENREIGILFLQKFNKIVMFYRMLYLEFSSKENLHKCSYSKGIPGHPKVLVKENPAWHKGIKGNNVYQQCKQICDKRDNCAVFAVNKKAKPLPLCHTFTYTNLKQKAVLWDQHNTNMKWVSKNSTVEYQKLIDFFLIWENLIKLYRYVIKKKDAKDLSRQCRQENLQENLQPHQDKMHLLIDRTK